VTARPGRLAAEAGGPETGTPEAGAKSVPSVVPKAVPKAVPKVVYEYATLRVVPSIERGEAMNVGVVLYCQKHDFLGCRTRVDDERLRTLASDLDLDGVRHVLRAVDAVCCGDQVQANQSVEESLGGRFRWLTAPRSTIVQPGPVHPGLTHDPAAELDRLFAVLVG
jgi:hypothetical protein